MVQLQTSQDWFHQSSLLLKARPTTTRITTKYNIIHPDKLAKKSLKRKTPSEDADTAKPDAPTGPKATLTLKSYDPVSGVTLKYETDKAAEVGRLIASLGSLGRSMAALPEIAEDATLLDAPAEAGTGTHTPLPEAATKESKPAASEAKTGQGGGGKKKKKGKK